MRSVKFIHALIIVVLCYGQFVSNVHSISHLHSHHDHSAHSELGSQPDACSDFYLSNTLNLQQCDAPVNKQAQVDNDCSIYHQLLNLSGGVVDCRQQLAVPQRTASKPQPLLTIITSVAMGNQSIRAPPALS